MTESRVTITKVVNARGESIETGYIVTVIDNEHVYGTGEVYRLKGHVGAPWFALVRWEQNDIEPRYEWLEVDELTNINVAARDRTLSA